MDDATRELIKGYAYLMIHRVDDAIANSEGKDLVKVAFALPYMDVDPSDYGEVRSIILNMVGNGVFLDLVKVINIDMEQVPVTDAYNDLNKETPEEVEGFFRVRITARAANED